MIHRLRTACLGVMLVGAWCIPALAMANPQPDEPATELSEPGVELMVSGLMKACHLLIDQGMYHHAAELARQAYALDPERVLADPLIYKMHLLAKTPLPPGAHEESEPQTCPYCPAIGKPINGIVPQKKKSEADDTAAPQPLPPIDCDFEVRADASRGLRLAAECAVGSSVYHLRFQRGCLAIWKTADAGKSKP